jgi:hypothetical protein
MEPTTVVPPIEDQDSPEKQTTPKKKILIISVIVLGVILTVITGYLVYTKLIKEEDTNTDQENTQVEENNNEEEDETDVCEIGEDCEEETIDDTENQYTDFEGVMISATLPKDWRIIEYFDGDGTESLPDMGLDYSGLTAFDVVNPDDKQVFTVQAVSGIGFVGCPGYAVFIDDSPSYHAEQESASTEMGETLNTTDYTDADYEEFEWLGVTFRRIDDKYFYDTQEGNNYFEPPCVDGLLTLEGLYFEDSDGYKYEAYFYGPTEDATEDDLMIVDQILESMEII